MNAERGVSIALDYIIMLGIATVVLASVTFIAGEVIDTQHDRAIEEELTATGETLAADIQSAERLANSSGDAENSTVELTTQLPNLVGGASYSITVNGSAQELHLITTRPAVEIIVPFTGELVLEEEQVVNGGTVEIVLNGDGNLEVKNA